MKTLLLAALLLAPAAPSFASVNPKATAPSSLSDLTADDMQFLSTYLFLAPEDDLVKGLSPKQRDDVHRLIASKKLDQTAKIDQVSQYLTNVWADGLDKRIKQA